MRPIGVLRELNNDTAYKATQGDVEPVRVGRGRVLDEGSKLSVEVASLAIHGSRNEQGRWIESIAPGIISKSLIKSV